MKSRYIVLESPFIVVEIPINVYNTKHNNLVTNNCTYHFRITWHHETMKISKTLVEHINDLWHIHIT